MKNLKISVRIREFLTWPLRGKGLFLFWIGFSLVRGGETFHGFPLEAAQLPILASKLQAYLPLPIVLLIPPLNRRAISKCFGPVSAMDGMPYRQS